MLAGTEVSWPTTEVTSLPVGGAAVLPGAAPDEPPLELASTNATTTAMTAMIEPPAR